LPEKVVVRPAFCLMLCLSVLLLPVRLVVAWSAAAAIHEMGHVLALMLMRIPIRVLTIDYQGAQIKTGHMSKSAELICALAGPCFGLMCLLFANITPYLAICGFIQSVYNLLPFHSHDGERVLRTALLLILPGQTAVMILKCVSISVAVFLSAMGMYLWIVCDLGFSVFLLLAFPVLKSLWQKYLANRRNK